MNTEPARLSPLSRQELPHGRVLAEPNSAAVGTCLFIRESAAHSSFRHIDDEKAAEPHLDVGIRAILHQALSVAQFHGCSGFRRLKNRPADENASILKACLGRPSCPIGLLLPGTGKQREAQGGFRDQEEVVHGRPLSWVRASLAQYSARHNAGRVGRISILHANFSNAEGFAFQSPSSVPQKSPREKIQAGHKSFSRAKRGLNLKAIHPIIPCRPSSGRPRAPSTRRREYRRARRRNRPSHIAQSLPSPRRLREP